MGTNYYARIIPSRKRKKELTDLIENSEDFNAIINLTNDLYAKLFLDDYKPCGGVVHLGKKSCGWKFLWNPNVHLIRQGHLEKIADGYARYVADKSKAYYVYPLTKEGIKNFIFRDDIVIYDEYNEKVDKNEFIDIGFGLGDYSHTQDDYDCDKYYDEEYKDKKNIPYWMEYENEMTALLEEEGFKLGKYKFDFYSDGLRFSTSNEFS